MTLKSAVFTSHKCLIKGDHKLAVRDLSIALEYGGLDSEELLDFLLTHHVEDEIAERQKNEESIDHAIRDEFIKIWKIFSIKTTLVVTEKG